MLRALLNEYYRRRLDRRYRKRKRLAQKSPEKMITGLYENRFGKKPDLQEPKTFNEKMCWMKLFWYDERAQRCSDKYLVRDFVREKGLGHLLVELIAVYDDPDEIVLDELPERFVLKATHDSGQVCICKKKSEFHLSAAISQLKRELKVDYEYMGGEWPYASDHKRIICEEYLEDKEAGELYDYKFFCFGGKAEMIFFCSNREEHVNSDFYDLDWNLLPFRWEYEPSGKVFPRPAKLEQMIEYAEILAEGFPFVRVDLYEIGEKIYFGELTFFHGCGLGAFQPEERDYFYGSKIVLPERQDPWGRIAGSGAKGVKERKTAERSGI